MAKGAGRTCRTNNVGEYAVVFGDANGSNSSTVSTAATLSRAVPSAQRSGWQKNRDSMACKTCWAVVFLYFEAVLNQPKGFHFYQLPEGVRLCQIAVAPISLLIYNNGRWAFRLLDGRSNPIHEWEKTKTD